MDLQTLLLGRTPGCRLAASDVRPDVVGTGSSSSVGGLTVDCHRSTLHDVDVLLLRHHQPHHRHHHPGMMMQYSPSPSQHAAAAAAAAIGLGTAGSSPYYGPYYQRSSSSAPQQCYLPLSHGLADSSRQAFTSSVSYEHHAAALLRDTASRLADSGSAAAMLHSHDASSRLAPPSNYTTDCLPATSPRYYRTARAQLQSTTSHGPAVGGVAGAGGGGGGGAFSWYLRPPVNTTSFNGDCVCQWLDSTTSSQLVKLKVHDLQQCNDWYITAGPCHVWYSEETEVSITRCIPNITRTCSVPTSY